MTDREKLIEMLKTIYKEYSVSPSDDLIANYLISHGVTVREKGEWVAQIPEDEKYCWSPFKCSVCNMPGGKHKTNFCPNCGADLRRKNDI